MDEPAENENAVPKGSTWTLWQLLDSLLPTGGFAHSYGLEAAVQLRFVQNLQDLEAFLINVLENSGCLFLPFVYRGNTCPELQEWIKIDQILHSTLTNAVSRKSSMAQGSALLRVASKVFVEIPQLKEMRERAVHKRDEIRVHHASVFGVLTGLLGFDSVTAQNAFLFMSLRDVLSSATRLNLVGPLEAASLQHRVSEFAEKVLRRYMNRPIEEACQTAPLLDTVQGFHDYLFSRLFRS